MDPEQVDVPRFENLIARARRTLDGDDAVGSRTAVSWLEQALGLWQGEPLAGLEGLRFAREEAARLTDLQLGATELLLQTQLVLGDADSVAERARQFVRANPYRERGWCALMLALYRCGRQSEALAAAARLRRTLATELGSCGRMPHCHRRRPPFSICHPTRLLLVHHRPLRPVIQSITVVFPRTQVRGWSAATVSWPP